jgi:hypothetical protein
MSGRPSRPFLTSRTPDAHAIVAACASASLRCSSRCAAYSANAGQVTAAGPSRQVQFGIKLVF